MAAKKIETPLAIETIAALKAGDECLLSGVIYTARDAAHKRLAEMIRARKKLPFDLGGAVIYYAGPTPAPPGRAIGSVGPTTSGRMDAFAPLLLARGLKGMIGKGPRSREVVDAMKKRGAVYFAAIGGAGALISKSVISSEVVAFENLGTEAIRRLVVKDMPLVVINDARGRDFYATTATR